MMQEKKTARQQARDRSRMALVDAFDRQPSTARIPGDVLDLLTGRSKPTRWRWIAAGKLPRPGADGAFNVGEVRAALAQLGEARDSAQSRSARARAAA